MILGWQQPGKVGQRGGFSFSTGLEKPAWTGIKPLTPHPSTRRQRSHAGVDQLVEHYLAKVDVASSNLVSRSIPLTPAVGAFLLLCTEANPSQ